MRREDYSRQLNPDFCSPPSFRGASEVAIRRDQSCGGPDDFRDTWESGELRAFQGRSGDKLSAPHGRFGEPQTDNDSCREPFDATHAHIIALCQ